MNEKPKESAYLEVNINTDFITINLVPAKAKLLKIGDKLQIDRTRIKESDFYEKIICDHHRNLISINEKLFFPKSSNLSIIKITERLFYENKLELHGKIIFCDKFLK